MSKDKIKFLPLGGSDEIGMNLNVYEYQDEILLVDMGVMFGDRYGMDVIMPDISYLIKNKNKMNTSKN